MVRKLLCFAFVFLWAIPALGQKSVPAWPAGLDTIRYPIFHKVEPMSAMKIAELGLRPVRLDTAIVVFNWTEARKRFQVDTLQKGVVVAVDRALQPIYKVDCGNRLGMLPLGASVSSIFPTSGIQLPFDSTARRLLASDSASKGFWAGLGDRLGDAAREIGSFLWGLLKFLGAFLGLGLVLLLGVAIFAGLSEVARGLLVGGRLRRGGTPPAPTSAPAPAPAAPFVASPAPVVPITTPPATPLASTTEVPVATSATRRFISYYPGEDHRIRFSGLRDVRFEEEEGVTTLRFRNA